MGGNKAKRSKNTASEEVPKITPIPEAYRDRDNQCDAIIVAQACFAGSEQRIKDSAKQALTEVLNSEDLVVERGNITAVGNIQGLALANLPHAMRIMQGQATVLDREMAGLKEKVTRLEAEGTKYRSDIASLQACISGLKISLNAYQLLRHRFIGTFKRDKLGKSTSYDNEMIFQANKWAHGGDAAADCQLYKGIRPRKDPYDFERLYGFPWEVVDRLSK